MPSLPTFPTKQHGEPFAPAARTSAQQLYRTIPLTLVPPPARSPRSLFL